MRRGRKGQPAHDKVSKGPMKIGGLSLAEFMLAGTAPRSADDPPATPTFQSEKRK